MTEGAFILGLMQEERSLLAYLTFVSKLSRLNATNMTPARATTTYTPNAMRHLPNPSCFPYQYKHLSIRLVSYMLYIRRSSPKSSIFWEFPQEQFVLLIQGLRVTGSVMAFYRISLPYPCNRSTAESTRALPGDVVFGQPVTAPGNQGFSTLRTVRVLQ